MNSNRSNDPDFWPENQYDRWGQYRQPQQPPQNRQQGWPREHFQPNPNFAHQPPQMGHRNEFRPHPERENQYRNYGPNPNQGRQHEHDQNRFAFARAHSGRPEQTDFNSRRADYPDANPGRQNFPENRFNHRSGHYNPGNNAYQEGNRNYGHEQHRPHHTSLGIGAIGGSFTSYSASRSRTGAMGHARANNMLNREGPGMNSYSHGDINANSNW